MKLEDQLEELTQLGLTLNDGVTMDDLLYSLDREDYEEKPFSALISILGAEVEREPWGRPFSSQVWNFDLECIYGTGDYVKIVQRLCEIAQSNRIATVEDYVDLTLGQGWLKYSVDDVQRKWVVEINGDWADTLTVSYVMSDIERNDHRFYSQSEGQVMTLFYFDEETANSFQKLTHINIAPAVP